MSDELHPDHRAAMELFRLCAGVANVDLEGFSCDDYDEDWVIRTYARCLDVVQKQRLPDPNARRVRHRKA